MLTEEVIQSQKLTLEDCIQVLRIARHENMAMVIAMEREYYQTDISAADFLKKYDDSILAHTIVQLDIKEDI